MNNMNKQLSLQETILNPNYFYTILSLEIRIPV